MPNDGIAFDALQKLYWMALGQKCYETAKEKQHDTKDTGLFCGYLHEEVSEMFGHWRDGFAPDELFYTDSDIGPKPDGIPAEVAGLIIRLADWCFQNNIDLAHAIDQKMAYNKTRPVKHGRSHS